MRYLRARRPEEERCPGKIPEKPIRRRYLRGNNAEVVNCTAAFIIGYRG
jgi:hypothetical protein